MSGCWTNCVGGGYVLNLDRRHARVHQPRLRFNVSLKRQVCFVATLLLRS